jgi:hypothetical protein
MRSNWNQAIRQFKKHFFPKTSKMNGLVRIVNSNIALDFFQKYVFFT